MNYRLGAALAAAIAAAATANGDVELVPFGQVPPPTEVGGVAVTPFPFDARIFSDVHSIPDGYGRHIQLSHAMGCRQIGFGWATWSHGWTGNAYYDNGWPDVTVTFPPGTKAAYFYAEPGPFGLFELSVLASDGVSTEFDDQLVEGMAGASGWGIYSKEGFDIVYVRVIGDVDFALGEFGISPPCPADLDVDGFVDFTDFLLFLNYYEAADPKVDYTEDGLVDFADYLVFLNWYGNSCEED